MHCNKCDKCRPKDHICAVVKKDPGKCFICGKTGHKAVNCNK